MRLCHLPFALLLVVPRLLVADTTVIDFESFADSAIITNQISGLTFANTIVLTAGVSLNEVSFPPRSGVNVVSDNGGPIGIVFDTPILGFSAYFTYVKPLSLLAFDASNTQIASALSSFSKNTGIGGDSGSSPNELLQVSFLSGISSVSITGDTAGRSFAMDDVTLTTPSSAVPEPSGLFLESIGFGLTALLLRRRLRS